MFFSTDGLWQGHKLVLFKKKDIREVFAVIKFTQL